MEHVLGLKCLVCGEKYTLGEVEYVCPHHGNDGILDVVYDYGVIGRRARESRIPDLGSGDGIWRYRPLLPVRPDAAVPPLLVGDTPLYAAPRLAGELGLKEVWVKDDGRQPSASFKDRASAMAVVKAQEKGAQIIATASTGNAAAALACICASVEQPNVIFVPASAPPAKIAQLLVFGSTVLLVDGTYDDAFELCLEACQEFGWYNRNTAYNPYMTEGKKTVVFEICEQLAGKQHPDGKTRWAAPDVVVAPVGDGCIIGGVHKGFKDLLALNWIDRMPRIIGVQSAGSDYMWQAWSKDEDVLTKPPIKADTVADSISAGLPRDRIKAMAAVRETGGAYVRVEDDAILAAIPKLGRGVGVFAEPAAAASYAGLEKAAREGLVSPDERVVILATGSGLKDVKSAMRSVGEPYRVKPDLTDVKRVLSKR
ncbi:MAG: threonine synthase [Anaerolineales bacterium]|nr:threonine synthase [Anaerolineales bacterium]